MHIQVEFPLSILEELTEGKKRCAFEKKLSQNASRTKNIHCFRQLSFLLTAFNPRRSKLIGRLAALRTVRRVKTFRSDVTVSPTRRVEIISEVRWVVERKIGWLKRWKICDIDPVPGRNKNVLRLYISVRDFLLSRIAQTSQYLKWYPLLLDGSKKWSSTLRTLI